MFDPDEKVSLDTLDALDKMAMARRSGEVAKVTRDLEWQRYIEGASPVPSLMRYDIEKKIRDYRSFFAPYSQGANTPAITNALNRWNVGFGGMVFAFYAKDDAIVLDDYNDLFNDTDPALGATPEEQQQTKKVLKRTADFIMNKGVKVLPPPVAGHDDPADENNYGNLSDQHLSDFGYAFRGIDGVKVHRGQLTESRKVGSWNPTLYKQPLPPLKRKRRATDPDRIDPQNIAQLDNPSDLPWIWAERAYALNAGTFTQQGPDGKPQPKIAEIEVRKNQQGNWAPFFVFKRLDPTTRKLVVIRTLPVLAEGVDIEDHQTFKGGYKYMKGGAMPSTSYVLLPEGPGDGKPLQMVHGHAGFFNDLLSKHNEMLQKGETSTKAPDLNLYADKGADGNPTYRQFHQLSADPNHSSKLWRIIFDGPEGGLLVRNVKDPNIIAPLGKDQADQLINWGQDKNLSYASPADPHYIKRLWHVYPPVTATDINGRHKPLHHGEWEMVDADKEKIRAHFKAPMDLLSRMLQKYGMARQTKKAVEQGLPPPKTFERHTATQGWQWVLVSPRYANATIVQKLKGNTTGRGLLYNSTRDVTYNSPNPLVQPQVTAAIHPLLEKLAAAYNVSVPGDTYEGVRDWLVVAHDLNPEKQEETQSKRGPYETIGGKPGESLPTAQTAIDSAFSHFGLSQSLKPDAKEIAEAQTAFDAAAAEITAKKIVPDVENEATKAELAALQVVRDAAQKENASSTETDHDVAVEHPLADKGETLHDLFGDVIAVKQKRRRVPKQQAVPSSAQPVIPPSTSPNALPPESPMPLPTTTPPSPKRKSRRPVDTGPSLFDVPLDPAAPHQASSDIGRELIQRTLKKYGL